MGNAKKLISEVVVDLKRFTTINNVEGTVSFGDMDMAMRHSLLLVAKLTSAIQLGLDQNDEMVTSIVKEYIGWVDNEFKYSW